MSWSTKLWAIRLWYAWSRKQCELVIGNGKRALTEYAATNRVHFLFCVVIVLWATSLNCWWTPNSVTADYNGGPKVPIWSKRPSRYYSEVFSSLLTMSTKFFLEILLKACWNSCRGRSPSYSALQPVIARQGIEEREAGGNLNSDDALDECFPTRLRII